MSALHHPRSLARRCTQRAQTRLFHAHLWAPEGPGASALRLENGLEALPLWWACGSDRALGAQRRAVSPGPFIQLQGHPPHHSVCLGWGTPPHGLIAIQSPPKGPASKHYHTGDWGFHIRTWAGRGNGNLQSTEPQNASGFYKLEGARQWSLPHAVSFGMG